MRAGSAQELMPTRMSDDLLVHPRRDDAENADGLRDVLETALAQALQDELAPDTVGGRRPHDDLARLGRAGEAGGDVGGGPGGGEGPPLAGPRADLRRANQRLTAVDTHVQPHRREHATVLLVQLLGALADGEGGARGVQGVVAGSGL